MKQEEKLIKNWTESSSGYSSSILKELNSFKRQAWTELILKNAGREGKLNILDVGTGPGFFAIIMSLQGHDVTAIDCTQAMLDEAQHNAELFGVHPHFLLSDTQTLDFPNDTFDLVISRNVVWTIMDAEKAFREWRRVLKPGGRMIAFDANWNLRLFDETSVRSMSGIRRSIGRHIRIFRSRFILRTWMISVEGCHFAQRFVPSGICVR